MSIPDQKRQGETWCAARDYDLVETFVEPGASATSDKRPEFQRMIDLALKGDGTRGPMGVKAIVTHLNGNHIYTRDGGSGRFTGF